MRTPAAPAARAQGRAGHGPTTRCPRLAARRQRGNSLIEVLVTMVLLTLGITSMTNLQVTALKLNHTAYLRSQAVALSYEVLDAMRADRIAALAGAYDRALDDPIPSEEQASASLTASNLRHWLLGIENAMRPYDGQASIERDGVRFTVTLRWRDRLRQELLGERRRLYEQFSVVTEL